MLIRLVYVSRFAETINRAEIDALITKAADFNKSNGITGVIAFEGTRVCQILEGEDNVVAALFDRIEADSRHSAVNELDRSEINSKHFKDWGMAERTMADMVTLAFSI